MGYARRYYDWLRAEYTRKRSVLLEGLAAAGCGAGGFWHICFTNRSLAPMPPEGGFFVMADTSGFDVPARCVFGGCMCASVCVCNERAEPSMSVVSVSCVVSVSHLAASTPACPTMTRDWAFARWLTTEHGVACIPPSAFYCEERKVSVCFVFGVPWCLVRGGSSGHYRTWRLLARDSRSAKAMLRLVRHLAGCLPLGSLRNSLSGID